MFAVLSFFIIFDDPLLRFFTVGLYANGRRKAMRREGAMIWVWQVVAFAGDHIYSLVTGNGIYKQPHIFFDYG